MVLAAIIVVAAAIVAGVFVYLTLTSSSTSNPSPTITQHNSSSCVPANYENCSITLGSPLDVGDIIVVAVGVGGGGISSINIPTDYAGNHFTQITTSSQTASGSTSSQFVGEYYAPVTSASVSDTVEASWGSVASAWLEVLVIRGYGSQGIVSSSGQGTNGSACSVSSSSADPSSIVIGFCFATEIYNPSCTPSTAFTVLNCVPLGSAYSMNWSGGTYSNLLSFTGGPSNWNAVAASFNLLPSVSMTASTSSGVTPLAVTFTSSVSGGTGSYSYAWTFGNGQTSQSASPSTTYTSSGTYLVQLTVTDSSGAQASASLSISVSSTTTTKTSSSKTTSSSNTTVTTNSTSTSQLVGLSIVGQNLTVDSTQIKGPLQISGNLSLSNVQSSTTIQYLIYNSTGVQFVFSSPGPLSISLDTTRAPLSVWADSTPISSWIYSNGTLSISSDPSSLTIIFPIQQSTIPPPPVFVNFLEANWILLLIIIVIAAAAFGAAVRRR